MMSRIYCFTTRWCLQVAIGSSLRYRDVLCMRSVRLYDSCVDGKSLSHGVRWSTIVSTGSAVWTKTAVPATAKSSSPVRTRYRTIPRAWLASIHCAPARSVRGYLLRRGPAAAPVRAGISGVCGSCVSPQKPTGLAPSRVSEQNKKKRQADSSNESLAHHHLNGWPTHTTGLEPQVDKGRLIPLVADRWVHAVSCSLDVFVANLYVGIAHLVLYAVVTFSQLASRAARSHTHGRQYD